MSYNKGKLLSAGFGAALALVATKASAQKQVSDPDMYECLNAAATAAMGPDADINRLPSRLIQIMTQHGEIYIWKDEAKKATAAYVFERDRVNGTLVAGAAGDPAILDPMMIKPGSVGTEDPQPGKDAATILDSFQSVLRTHPACTKLQLE